MATKRPHSATTAAAAADNDPVDPSDELMFLALGGGNEVGRSCHIIQYKGKTVMLDAGVHPAYSGLAALPFYDEFDLSTVDLLLVTHFHMDHAASLPYVLAKTNFAGRVYMTHPTKAIYKYLIQDALRVHNTHTSTTASASSGTDGHVTELFNEQDLLATLPLINTVGYHTTHTHNGIRFTPLPAGHVLGACMYVIEIAGLNILFTGDYSRENDRHLIPASVPANVKIDCLITESTFGISTHIPRVERETALMKSVTGILNRGGRALLPVFAVGRSQELLLILEEYWTRHPEYQKYGIYYASSLARKCMLVYQTYIESMNENIRGKMHGLSLNSDNTTADGSKDDKEADMTAGGPWDLRHIRALRSLDRFDDTGGCVMLASPGMLQNGVSRALLERWAPDPRNGVVITGYSVEGTMAKEIMREPESIPAVMIGRSAAGPSLGGKRGDPGAGGERAMIPRKCSVQEFSFAAHVDGQENREFVEAVNAPVVILVHGERHNMARFRSRLLSLERFKVYSPGNCEEVRIPFRRDRIARVVGRLAEEIGAGVEMEVGAGEDGEDGEDGEGQKKRRQEGRLVSGVLVQNDFKLSLMAPEDLKEYAGLTTTTVLCRQRITLAAAGTELIKWALEGMFGSMTTVRGAQANGATNGMKHEHADAELDREQPTTFEIMGAAVRVICHADGEVELEWEGNVTNDGIADGVMAVLLSVESSPAAVRKSSALHKHSHGGIGDVQDELPGGGKENGEKRKDKNPFANVSAEEKLSRLFMFLEAQFGEDAISPLPVPKLPLTAEPADIDEDDTKAREKAEATELARLHALGLPVPGLEIRVDKSVARVWLERLEVECANKVLADRVKAVVERAVEVVAPLWL